MYILYYCFIIVVCQVIHGNIVSIESSKKKTVGDIVTP